MNRKRKRLNTDEQINILAPSKKQQKTNSVDMETSLSSISTNDNTNEFDELDNKIANTQLVHDERQLSNNNEQQMIKEELTEIMMFFNDQIKKIGRILTMNDSNIDHFQYNNHYPENLIECLDKSIHYVNNNDHETYDKITTNNTVVKESEDPVINEIKKKTTVMNQPDTSSSHCSQKYDHELEKGFKLSALNRVITELYTVKLQITSLFEIKSHADFKLQSKKEQSVIMDMVEMLKDMKDLSLDYYNAYCKENIWAQHLMDTFDNDLFKDPYSAFH